MGWNSWDSYFFSLIETEAKATADYMSDSLRKYDPLFLYRISILS